MSCCIVPDSQLRLWSPDSPLRLPELSAWCDGQAPNCASCAVECVLHVADVIVEACAGACTCDCGSVFVIVGGGSVISVSIISWANKL